jgi:hypothetical protein
MSAGKKRLINSDPRTWGIKPHWGIPQALIDRMAGTKGFSIRYVKRAAKRYVNRILFAIENEMKPVRGAVTDPEGYRCVARDLIQYLPPPDDDDPSDTSGSRFALGEILEQYIIADMFEARQEKIERQVTV